MSNTTPPPRPGLLAARSSANRSLWHHWGWWAALGYCALLLTAYQFGKSVAFLDIFATLIQYLPLCLGGSLTLWLGSRRVAGLHRRTRQALRLMSAGLGLFAVGMACYTWSHWVENSPFGSAILGDLFYLPGYVLILVALLVMPTRRAGAYRGWHFALDTGVVLVGAALAMWYLVVRPTLVEGSQGFDLFVRLAYPALGLGFLLALNALALRGGPMDRSGAFRLIALGVICYVIADGTYQVLYYSALTPSPLSERLSEATYMLSYLLWLGGGLRLMLAPRVARPKESTVLAHSVSSLPLMVAVGVVALLTAVAFMPWNPETSPLILGLVVLTTVLVARLGFTARQNTILLRQQVQQQGDARVAALVRHASDLIMVTETNAMIRFASPSLRWTLGRSPNDLIGSWLGTLIHPDDGLALAEAIDNATNPNHSSRITTTLRFMHVDGSSRECEVVTTDLSGEPAVQGMVLVARDLTERRALESRLHQAQKMEAVGRLAGGIAHDFNNVLTTVLAETELMLEHPERTLEDREALQTVKQAGQQAAALTRQLLAFARQQVPSARSLDLEELVTATIRLFGHSASAITVERRVSENLPAAWADPNQLSQVLLNLLLNARDAMPAGGTITVSLRAETLHTFAGDWALEPAPGHYVAMEVADEGVGMDANSLQRAFEPFFSTKASGHGTGLGLPTVLSTIEKHRGGLRVTSAQGVGTRITVLLPVSRVTLPEPEAESTQPVSTPRGRERILLVDDEESVRDVTRRILERLGYEVELAAGAEQARRVVSVSGVPDILVTDVIMPGESGAQLAESLLGHHPALPVLFISGFTGDELQRQGTLRPGTILLQKPYTPQELGAYVRGVLDGDFAPVGVGAGEIASAVRS